MSTPPTFRAAIVPKAGAQHVISDRSLAPLEPGEIGIKVTATAINPVDWKIRDGLFPVDFPALLGADAAGEVAAVGPGVTGFGVGDRVFWQGIIGGKDYCTFQQYAKIPAALAGRTPTRTSDDEAAGVSLATVAGLVALYDGTGRGLAAPWDEGGDRAGRGKAIVILGGSSSVGQYAIQMARLSGFERIVTNSSAAHVNHLKSLGAHQVLDRSRQGSAEDFKSAIGGLPLAFVLDTISDRGTQALAVQILHSTKTPDGLVVLMLPVDAEADALGRSLEPNVTLRTTRGMGSNPALRYLSEPLMKHLGGEDGYIATGRIVPNRPQVVAGGLAGLEEALAKQKQGVSGVKVVIRPCET